MNLILVGYAQTAAVGIVLMTGSPVYTGLSGRSVRLSFDLKDDLFSSLFLTFRCQGRVVDLCLTKHTVFEGSAALSVGPDPQKLAKACDLMCQGSRIWLDHSSGAPRVVI